MRSAPISHELALNFIAEHVLGLPVTAEPRRPVRQGQQQRAVFAIVSSGVVLATLDQFVVNVALPAISSSLHDNIPGVSWVLNGYSIVFAALLVPAGRLADRNGRKGSFITGVAVFTAASAACAVSSTLAQLIVARVLQAVGAALLMPSSLGLLLAAHSPERRAAAVRAWTAVIGVSAALGPVAGGLLVTASWRWIFLVNLPIGIAAIIFAARWLPAAPAGGGPLPDFPGAAAIALGIGALSLGLVKAQDWGWASARTFSTFAAGLVLGVVFLWRSGRHPSPVLEFSVLRIPRFAIATAATIVYSAAFSSALLSINLWIQAGWGWSPLRFGLAFAPGPMIVPLMAPCTGRIIRHAGAGATAAIGCLILSAGALIRIILIGDTPDYPSALLPAVILTGLGVALALPTLTSVGAASLPQHRFAAGSGALNMSRQFGFTMGVAIAVAVLGHTRPSRPGLPAIQHTWIATAALAVIAAAVAIQLARYGNGGTVTPPGENQGTAPASQACSARRTTPPSGIGGLSPQAGNDQDTRQD